MYRQMPGGIPVATVAIGKAAGAALTSGAGNLAVGSGSLLVMTTGDYNTAIGHRALKTNVSGDFNVAVGYEALTTANEDTANQNTALGYKALTLLTTGINNTAVGSLAGGEGTITGDSNTLIGKSAGATLAGGARNVAIGTNALKVLTAGGTADLGNVAIGYGALDSLQTGMSNVAIGVAAMDGAAGAVSNCVVIGDRAADGALTTAADGTVALGYHALGALTSGGGNTAVGFEAGKAMTTGANLTAVGYQAGLLLPAGANSNTAIGSGALSVGNASTTDHNTCVGYLAGDDITDGQKNTIIGSESDPLSGGGSNQTAIGYGVAAVADNSVTLGNDDVTRVNMAHDGAAVMYANGTINTSDIRFKKNVEDTDLGLEFINKVRPVKYDFKEDKGDGKKRYGIIAQEVLTVLKDSGNEDFAGIRTDNPDKLGADYIQFVAPLIKAVQELTTKVEEQAKRIEELEN